MEQHPWQILKCFYFLRKSIDLASGSPRPRDPTGRRSLVEMHIPGPRPRPLGAVLPPATGPDKPPGDCDVHLYLAGLQPLIWWNRSLDPSLTPRPKKEKQKLTKSRKKNSPVRLISLMLSSTQARRAPQGSAGGHTVSGLAERGPKSTGKRTPGRMYAGVWPR